MSWIPTTAVAAGGRAVAVALILLLLGYLMVTALGAARGDLVLRAGLAFPALCIFVFCISMVHVLTGGAMLSSPWIVRFATISIGAISLAFYARRRPANVVPGRAIALVLVLLAAGLAVWGLPAFRQFPLRAGGDTQLHLGWAMQMMNGESTPSIAVTGEVPNAYPWFFHALLAFVANLIPGGRAFDALVVTQFLQVGGVILSLFALGRELTKRWLGAVIATIFGALSGGVGYFVARGPALVEDVRAEPNLYLGDLLLKRSYNSSFHNLVPPLPRDIGFALIVAFLLLVIRGLRRSSRAELVTAGVIAGIIGLVGAETFFFCVAVTCITAICAPAGRRFATFLPLILPMMAIWAIWLIPLIVNYLRYGGFVDTSFTPVTLSFVGVLGGWGLITPFAAVGLLRSLPRFRHDVSARIVVVIATAGAALLGLSTASEALGEGFVTLGRAHRYWPLLHLSLVPAAAIGAVAVAAHIPLPRRRTYPAALAAAVFVLSIPSPLLGSIAADDYLDAGPELTEILLGQDDAALVTIDRVPGGESCVVAVPDHLIHPAFSYTGYRMVRYRWGTASASNVARVRWAEMRKYIPWDEERRTDGRLLVHGTGTEESWDAVAEKYAVDHVITRVGPAESGTFGDAERRTVGDHVVFSRTDCGT